MHLLAMVANLVIPKPSLIAVLLLSPPIVDSYSLLRLTLLCWVTPLLFTAARFHRRVGEIRGHIVPLLLGLSSASQSHSKSNEGKHQSIREREETRPRCRRDDPLATLFLIGNSLFFNFFSIFKIVSK